MNRVDSFRDAHCSSKQRESYLNEIVYSRDTTILQNFYGNSCGSSLIKVIKKKKILKFANFMIQSENHYF